MYSYGCTKFRPVFNRYLGTDAALALATYLDLEWPHSATALAPHGGIARARQHPSGFGSRGGEAMDALSQIAASGGGEDQYIATIDKFLQAADEGALKDTAVHRAA
eukprot:SAG31_NODE_2281_length_6022_cov_3.327706_7_plen_106_part_00